MAQKRKRTDQSSAHGAKNTNTKRTAPARSTRSGPPATESKAPAAKRKAPAKRAKASNKPQPKEYEIECILAERGRGRYHKYLVRWDGYGSDEDSWEPASVLRNCVALDRWEGRGPINESSSVAGDASKDEAEEAQEGEDVDENDGDPDGNEGEDDEDEGDGDGGVGEGDDGEVEGDVESDGGGEGDEGGEGDDGEGDEGVADDDGDDDTGDKGEGESNLLWDASGEEPSGTDAQAKPTQHAPPVITPAPSDEYAGKFDWYFTRLPFLMKKYLPSGASTPSYADVYHEILKYQAKSDFSGQLAIDSTSGTGLFSCVALVNPMSDEPIESPIEIPNSKRTKITLTEKQAPIPSGSGTFIGFSCTLEMIDGDCFIDGGSGTLQMHKVWTDGNKELFEGYVQFIVRHALLKLKGFGPRTALTSPLWAVRARRDKEGRQIGLDLVK